MHFVAMSVVAMHGWEGKNRTTQISTFKAIGTV